MTDPIYLFALVLIVLEAKHFICDYTLQTSYQLLNKGTYLHPGGLVHAGLHALCTIPAFFVVMPTLSVGVGVVVGEFLVHYHIDWAKEQVIRHMGWTPMQDPFWWALGFDQLLHHWTYVVIAVVLVSVG